jgi:hypothetical protein
MWAICFETMILYMRGPCDKFFKGVVNNLTFGLGHGVHSSQEKISLSISSEFYVLEL